MQQYQHLGECGVDLAMRNPGCLNHSRWLTTANRILRLYVSDKKPSENLKTLVTYIIRVYDPMWFAIKTHSSCKDGARHLHQMLVKSRYINPKHKKSCTSYWTNTEVQGSRRTQLRCRGIFRPSHYRNSYFVHRRICSWP